MNISVVIIVKNGAKTMKKCLEALKDFSDVVVYDNGSSDGTQDIIKSFASVKLIEGEFFGFGPTKNKASSYAKNSWILNLDCDEVMEENLNKTLKNINLDENCVYKIRLHNYYKKKRIRYCGWGLEYSTRLYNKNKTTFNDNLVHEKIIKTNFNIKTLEGNVKHYSYLSISDFIQKLDIYSSLFAKEYAGKRKSSPFKAISHSLFAFFRIFILKKGFLDGFEGLLISCSRSNTAFFKYMKLYEMNRELKNADNTY